MQHETPETPEPLNPETAAARKAINKSKRAFEAAARYGRHEAARCPAKFLGGRTIPEWLALRPEERLRSIRHVLAEEYLPTMRLLIDAAPPPRVQAYLALTPEERAAHDAAFDARRTASALVETAVERAPQDAPASAPAARHAIPAACCGEPVPCASARPAVVYCHGTADRCPSRRR